MSATNFTDLSVVRLKDGREGTVVHVYQGGAGAAAKAAVLELNDDSLDMLDKLVDVVPNDVDCVLWEPKD